MQLFKVPQLPMEGPQDMLLRSPDTWDVQVHNMVGYNRPAVGMEQIQGALKNPIGTAPLRELAKGKKEVVIIFDDYTRGRRTIFREIGVPRPRADRRTPMRSTSRK